MIDFLLGVPGKLKAISDYLTTNWTAARAAKLDLLTVAPAPASTALSNTVWTSALATKVSGSAQVTEPLLMPPVANGCVIFTSTTYSQPTWGNAVSITGSGVLNFVNIKKSPPTSGWPTYARVLIDGILVKSITSPQGIPAGEFTEDGIGTPRLSGSGALNSIGGLDQIPFRTSLVIDHYSSSLTVGSVAVVIYRRTS